MIATNALPLRQTANRGYTDILSEHFDQMCYIGGCVNYTLAGNTLSQSIRQHYTLTSSLPVTTLRKKLSRLGQNLLEHRKEDAVLDKSMAEFVEVRLQKSTSCKTENVLYDLKRLG